MRRAMLLGSLASLGSARRSWQQPPRPSPRTAGPVTIFLCGDSTMAKLDASSGENGWGEYLHWSFDPTVATVANRAIAGRSARSFTREGRFDAVAQEVQSGDWVVIEFGHNDGVSTGPDNGRSDCLGSGNETCQGNYNGVNETVYTYGTYVKNASSLYLAKGAKVILSSPTPNDVWATGKYEWIPARFDYYPWLAAQELGGPDEGVYFVPHGEYGAQALKNLGEAIVNKNYPHDFTHTSPYLANIMAGAFVLGLTCGTSELGKMTLNTTASLESGGVYGDCIPHNATLPV